MGWCCLSPSLEACTRRAEAARRRGDARDRVALAPAAAGDFPRHLRRLRRRIHRSVLLLTRARLVF